LSRSGTGGATVPAVVTTQPPSYEHHPAIRNRPVEALALSEAVRRLIELSVTNNAPAAETAEIVERLNAVANDLATFVPEKPLPRFLAPTDAERAANPGPPLGAGMPYDIVVGKFNPLALPLTLEFEPDKAIGRAVFTRPYEGAPGCVHGAALAGAFDIVLTAANALVDATGPTVRLNLRFRRPTLILKEAVFEGWITEKTERRVHSLGRIIQAGEVTVEAEGEFAILDQKQVAKMAQSRHDAVARADDSGNDSAS
jgi:hypothetical protein